MLTLSAARRTHIQTRITAITAQLTALDAAMLLASAKDIEEYSFNSGDGMQRAINRDLLDMQKSSDVLFRTLEYLHNLLRGRGIVRGVIRRR